MFLINILLTIITFVIALFLFMWLSGESDNDL
nr:MAG TPA: Photosystem II reaction centre I protein (PSII 4.8 kDa protein) [Herelleviridae sp.]